MTRAEGILSSENGKGQRRIAIDEDFHVYQIFLRVLVSWSSRLFAIGNVFAGKKTKAVGIKSFDVLNDRLQFKKFLFNTGSFLLRPEISQNGHKLYLHLRKL